jgi:hypothetical protein
VSLARGAERFKLQAKASSPRFDFTALPRAATPEGTAKPAASGARMIPDVVLPLDLLRAIDADLDLRVDALKLSDSAQVGPLLVRATIADGRLNAEPVELANGAVQVLHASVTADAASSAWTLRLTGSGIDLGEMLTRFGQPQLVTGGSTDVELDVQGRGKTFRLFSVRSTATFACGSDRTASTTSRSTWIAASLRAYSAPPTRFRKPTRTPMSSASPCACR